jgi:sugar phosphate isomerase/epimerase
MTRCRIIRLAGTARTVDDVHALHHLGLGVAEVPITNPAKFNAQVPAFQEARTRTGMMYLCHGPREGNPNDTETLDSVYFPKVMDALSLMPALDMRVVTIHLWMDARFVNRPVLTHKIGFLRRLTDAACELGITVCLENLSEHAEHMAEVLASVPRLMLTLDVGHAQLLAEENSSFGLIKRYPERLRHIHLHDNRGGNSPSDDLHLPVGEGEIDIGAILNELQVSGYQGTMTLELRPHEIRGCLPLVRRLLSDSGFDAGMGENVQYRTGNIE